MENVQTAEKTPADTNKPIVVYDKNGKTRNALEKVETYWEGKTQIPINRSLLIQALLLRYHKFLLENEPSKLDLDKIF